MGKTCNPKKVETMRFLFTSNPLLGHFLPMVPLIRAAQAAGHQVRVATGADLAPEVHRHGLPIWAVGPKMSQAWAELAASADPTQDEAAQQHQAATLLFARPAVARARQLVPMAASWRPDVVVHELYELAGLEAAAAVGVTNVVHGFGTHLPDLAEFAEVVGSAVAEELGTPNRVSDLFDAPYLDPCPPSLQPPGASQFSNVVSIRPESGTSYPGEWLPDAMRRLPYQRTIYATLGTAFNAPEAWRLVLQAVREMEVNVVATTGSDLDPAELGPQPSHIAMARFVPQALVLRHVDAVVCHCGSGTMLGALAQGRPIVALPVAADQFANAEQVVRTGAGLSVPAEARTPDTIRSAIERVLDTLTFAQAAYALQAEIAAMPSAEQRVAELAERAGLEPASVG
jgi:UDP:flavonoid glycosyltransferase YjiC (YdhE family)